MWAMKPYSEDLRLREASRPSEMGHPNPLWLTYRQNSEQRIAQKRGMLNTNVKMEGFSQHAGLFVRYSENLLRTGCAADFFGLT